MQTSQEFKDQLRQAKSMIGQKYDGRQIVDAGLSKFGVIVWLSCKLETTWIYFHEMDLSNASCSCDSKRGHKKIIKNYCAR